MLNYGIIINIIIDQDLFKFLIFINKKEIIFF